MKRFLSLIAVFLCAIFLLDAQTSVWKVSKGGSDIYLAGTIHLLRPSDLPLPGAYAKALEQSDVLYVEADLNKLQDQQIAQQLMAKMMLPEGETLKDLLEDETYQLLEKECSSVGLPLVQLSTFKPALVIVSLSSMKLMKLGITGQGADMVLMKQVKEAGKPLKFMESVDFQIDLIAKMGEGEEDAFVRYSLEDMGKAEKEFLNLIEEWKVGGNTLMNESAVDMKSKFPKVYDSLLLERNNEWMTKIVPLFDNDETEMIAVGTLHLHGKDGLLSQLKAKGYKVIQLQ